MTEKVYCVYDYWDMTIIEGIAEYNNGKYYFKCISSIEDGNNYGWTDMYELTLLDDYIFKLSLENWEYWKMWLKNPVVPHPIEYAKSRKIRTLEEIFTKDNVEKELIEQTEKHYQNELLIEEYLKSTSPTFKAKGIFSGQINGMDTNVEWDNAVASTGSAFEGDLWTCRR